MRPTLFGAALAAFALFATPMLATPPELGRDWRVSDWPAGQTRIMDWSPRMVRQGPDGVNLILDRNPAAETDTTARPWLGGEIQSKAKAETGIWRWRVRVPEMVDGAVFGLFLYRADHEADPWREYDIEFVGSGTTELEINIHFEDDQGKRVSLGDALGGPLKVDLGFDAAQDFHDYEIEVQTDRAIFRIDGKVVADVGPDDMPGGVWSVGPLRSFVDLWAASPGQADWTGKWVDPGRPLIATVAGAEVPQAD